MLGAGILFHNNKSVLLGLKAHGKLRGKWTGFGGKLEEGESAAHGAVREILEEIYGIYSHDPLVDVLISALMDILPLTPCFTQHNYTLYCLNFEHLNIISDIINDFEFSTLHFAGRVPLTAQGLTSYFAVPERGAEFTRLGLFPIRGLERRRDVDRQVVLDLRHTSL